LRRCIVPVDGFFEWQANKGGKRPYAIAMKDGSPELEGLGHWRVGADLHHHHRPEQ
jgi:putative SOS response-associated peptidase YedK